MTSTQTGGLRRQKRGASLLSYGLLVGLIGVVALSAVTNIGDQTSTLFGRVSDRLGGVAGSGGGATSTPAPANQLPVFVSAPSNQTIAQSGSTGALTITLDDPDTDLNTLVLGAASSNQSLVADGDISLSGTGANRQIDLTVASGTTGTATITLTVDDGTDTAQQTFDVTVIDVTTASVFATSGNHSYTVPAGVTQISFAMWGAGGGSGTNGGQAGAGSAIIGTLTGLTPGGTVSILVGQGGRSGGNGGAGGFGGGGNGRVGMPSAQGGGGGGRSALFVGGVEVMTAAGGGGCGGDSANLGARAGGGDQNADGGSDGIIGATHGTSSTGGSGDNGAGDGTSLQGGEPHASNVGNDGGGGGGGGYFGGGAGSNASTDARCGAGGGSRVDNSAGSGTISAANAGTPGQPGHPDRNGIAGGATSNNNGGTGRVVIRASVP